jgi:hypothetical protein
MNYSQIEASMNYSQIVNYSQNSPQQPSKDTGHSAVIPGFLVVYYSNYSITADPCLHETLDYDSGFRNSLFRYGSHG